MTVNYKLQHPDTAISTALPPDPPKRRGHTIIADKLLNTLLDNVENYIVALEPDTWRLKYVNRTFRSCFGPNCLGGELSKYIPVSLDSCYTQRQNGNGMRCVQEVQLPASNQWLAFTIDLVPWLDGTNVYLVNGYDITARKKYEEGITRLAYQDYLTGLPNRYRCESDMKMRLGLANNPGGRGFLLFIDLDDFKVVNDCYGHDYGDGVLVAFARFMEQLFRPANEVYRIGGDEFVVAMSDTTRERVEYSIQAMLNRSRKPWLSLDREFYCGLSIGVAEFGPGVAEGKTALKQADIAMYHAKRQGKNSYSFYNAGLNQDALARTEMERLLRRAMQDGCAGFEVHYQPYHDVETGRIRGAEALLRMRGANGELLLPADFLGLAEYLGFMLPLGEFIMERAARECKKVNDAGWGDFSININVSASQFKQNGIVQNVAEVLGNAGVRFSNIVLGLGEETALRYQDRMRRLTLDFRDLGVRTALDSFGAGASSFLDMRNLPVDWLKISPRYVRTVEDPFNAHFVRLVTELARYTGKQVCMNGVENETQMDFCRELGVDLAQGYFLHRPGTEESLRQLVQNL